MSAFVLQLPRRASSVPEARAFVESAVIETALPDSRFGDLLIAVSEACSNVVAHAAGSDSLRVEVEEVDEEVAVTVSDTGDGFDAGSFHTMPPPDESGGRGLALMELLCDDVDLESSNDGTRIRLSMSVRSGELSSR